MSEPMTYAISDQLLREVHARLTTADFGWLSDLKDSGDYAGDTDATVDGPLKPIIAAVVEVLAQINGPTWTDQLSADVGSES